jgi:hypothetical protein
MKQVVTIHPDGTISGLQVKPGRGLDLTTFGHADVRRASDIRWHEEGQAWYVQPLGGTQKTRLLTEPITVRSYRTAVDLTAGEVMEALCDMAPAGVTIDPGEDGVLLFKSYDEAVKVEIAYLDGLRLKGVY